MYELNIDELEFFSPSEALTRLRQQNGNGIYFIALKRKSLNAFQSISPNFHNDLVSRNNCRLPSGDIILYIGKANGQGGLSQRLNQDLRQSGAAIFFRSVGAILMMNPYRGQTIPRNYKFKEPEKQAVIDFIDYNFLVAYITNTNEIDADEINFIRQYHPIFNTSQNPHPNVELAEQRKKCRNIAGQLHEAINSNAYVKVMRSAKEHNWCTDSQCTTCGAANFRKALEEINPILFTEMMKLNVSELKSFENWKDCTYIAIDYLSNEERQILHAHWSTVFRDVNKPILRI